jgi:hypothetical protein
VVKGDASEWLDVTPGQLLDKIEAGSEIWVAARDFYEDLKLSRPTDATISGDYFAAPAWLFPLPVRLLPFPLAQIFSC